MPELFIVGQHSLDHVDVNSIVQHVTIVHFKGHNFILGGVNQIGIFVIFLGILTLSNWDIGIFIAKFGILL